MAKHCYAIIARCAALVLIAWIAALGPAGMAAADSAKAPSKSAKFVPPPLHSQPLPTVASASAIHYPHNVVGLRDITYKTVTGYRPLKLDLYVPRDIHTLHPAVIWIHGGGWEMGNPRADWTYGDWTRVLAELAGRGYVVAGVTYRLSGAAKFPAALQDVKDAIRFVRKHADLYGVDPHRLTAWGLSAGGYLAAMVGTTCQAESFNAGTPYPGISSCVQAVVDWFGPTDFTTIKMDGASDAIAKFLGCDSCSPVLLEKASPVTYVTDKTPPFLIMQGSADPLVAPEQSKRLHELLKAHNVKSKLIIYPGLGHGFSGATKPQLQKILETTFKFIDQQMQQRRN